MDLLQRCRAGLDIPKDTVVACVRRLDQRDRSHREVRTFPTVTAGLLDRLAWLQSHGVTQAARESTGGSWKPVGNILEGRVQLRLVNAEPIKQGPGRQTDVRDCEWIAPLLRHGLLRAGFVPPAPIRDLRERTRQRTQLAAQKASASHRLRKVLEDANIKRGRVAGAVPGQSGRALREDLIAGGSDPERLADRVRGRMRPQRGVLRAALTGRVTENHRFLLRWHRDHVAQREGLLARWEQRVAEWIDRDRPPQPPPQAPPGPAVGASSAGTASGGASAGDAPPAGPVGLWQAVLWLMTIPGISRRTAEGVVAEVGTARGRFATSGRLASWAGLCPGNDESAGRRRSGRTRPGDKGLRAALVRSAWAASRTKTYLAAPYRRLAKRRGKKKALAAAAHSLRGVIDQALTKREAYRELGADDRDQLAPERLTRPLVKRRESLGHKVALEGEAA